MGKLARLLGGSCSVGVGLAVTAAVSKADARAKDFMVGSSAFVLSSFGRERSYSALRQSALCYLAAAIVVNKRQQREEQSERSESMCQLEEEKE